MHHKKTVTLLCSLVLLVAACGEVVPIEGIQTDASPEDRVDAMTLIEPCDGEVIAIDDLPVCFITAICEWQLNCGNIAPTVAECVNVLMQDQDFDLKRNVDAVNAGVVSYDGAEAALCLASVDTNNCNSLPGEGCDQVFVGTVRDGDPCYQQEECAGIDASCQDGGDCQDQCCLGSCEDKAPLKGDCSSRQCEDGTHCIQQGQPIESRCEAGDLNDACNSNNHCDQDLHCDVSGGTGTCQPDQGENSTCTSGSECLFPLDCVGNDEGTGGSGTCLRVDVVGNACENYCEGNLYCRIVQPATSGTCQMKEGDGGICNSDSQCQSNLYCNDGQGQCRMEPLFNMPCERFSCAPGLFCTNELPGSPDGVPGVCAEPVINSGSCNSDNHCESGICGGAQTCEPYMSCYP